MLFSLYSYIYNYFFTIELAIGNNMPSVNIPSKGPAVIPDKLLPAWNGD